MNAQLQLGRHTVSLPVVLAPMAGVTNAPFRALCREFGPGLVYVNEMVMATALVHGNARTQRMVTFGSDESPRSLQLYGSDPVMMGEAAARLAENDLVDHIDINFGCPAAKVTRRGGGAAVPLKRNLLRAILRETVRNARGIPVTCKFRMGISDDLITYLDTGSIAAEEGVAWIALHARTAEQHYAGHARWDAIAALKKHVPQMQVLGNGDIWDARDALRMIEHTGCDGVVVGRGCLGRPWLFRDLVDAFSGRPVADPPPLGFVLDVMSRHARALVDFSFPGKGIREFRKHTGWYFTGYPVGGEVRRRAAQAGEIEQLDELFAELDRDMTVVPNGERATRGHTNGPIRVALPDGYLDSLDDLTPPDDDKVAALSGG
jgi:nifR3 family TIM-barrel protein